LQLFLALVKSYPKLPQTSLKQSCGYWVHHPGTLHSFSWILTNGVAHGAGKKRYKEFTGQQAVLLQTLISQSMSPSSQGLVALIWGLDL